MVLLLVAPRYGSTSTLVTQVIGSQDPFSVFLFARFQDHFLQFAIMQDGGGGLGRSEKSVIEVRNMRFNSGNQLL